MTRHNISRSLVASAAIALLAIGCDRGKPAQPVVGSNPLVQGPGVPKVTEVRRPPAAPATQPLAPDADPDVLLVKIELVRFEMVKVPGGQIAIPAVDDKGRISKDSPPLKVAIKPFWMSRTEIPWEAYDVYAQRLDLSDRQKQGLAVRESHLLPAARSRPSLVYADPGHGNRREGFPAMSLHPHAAAMYCKWLSQRTGKKYRLPTEAEWEWAASAGGHVVTLTSEELDKVAWHNGNALNDDGLPATQEVGRKQPNGFGLRDMLGNVWEWCECLNDAHTPVARGGSYKDRPREVTIRARTLHRLAWQLRDSQDPKSAWWLSDAPEAGFRVVRDDD